MRDTMKRYTGGEDVTSSRSGRPDTRELGSTLGILDMAAALGITYTGRPFTAARKAQQRADELREAGRAYARNLDQRAADAVAGYVEGKDDPEQAVAALADLVPLAQADLVRELHRRVDAAARRVEAAGLRALDPVTEDTWLAPIVPAVAAAVADVDEAARAVGITAPRAARVGVRTIDDPWAPTLADLDHDMRLRHAWETFGARLDELQDVFTLADALRQYGYLPILPGRQTLEDYRWLHLDRLDGNPNRRREFWLANRDAGEPGLFTADQMRAADHVPEPQETDEHLDEPANV